MERFFIDIVEVEREYPDANQAALGKLLIAQLDGGLLHVEKILQHKGNINKTKEFFALVRWKGLTKKNDTWEPYKSISWNTAFKEYTQEQLALLEDRLSKEQNVLIIPQLKEIKRGWTQVLKRFQTDELAVRI